MAMRAAVSLCALLAIEVFASAAVAQKVRVDFYQESGCPDCVRVCLKTAVNFVLIMTDSAISNEFCFLLLTMVLCVDQTKN